MLADQGQSRRARRHPLGRGGAQFPLFAAGTDYIGYLQNRSIHGSPSRVREKLEQLAASYDVDEFIVLTITYNFAARIRSYELLADVFELSQRSPSQGELQKAEGGPVMSVNQAVAD